jgi:hypothetical protein
MAESLENPRPIPLIIYRKSPKISSEFKVPCPFCLVDFTCELTELYKHISICPVYDPFKDGLPTYPISAIKIHKDYNLGDYFMDERAYFEMLPFFANDKLLVEGPADSIDTLLEYIRSRASLHCDAAISPIRLQAIAWRILNCLFEMNDEGIERMIAHMEAFVDDERDNDGGH